MQVIELLLSRLIPFALVFGAEARRDRRPLGSKARVWDLREHPVEIQLMVSDYLYCPLRHEPTIEKGEKRLRKQSMFDVTLLRPGARKEGVHPLHRLRQKQSFQSNAGIDEEHAHVADFRLGDTA